VSVRLELFGLLELSRGTTAGVQFCGDQRQRCTTARLWVRRDACGECVDVVDGVRVRIWQVLYVLCWRLDCRTANHNTASGSRRCAVIVGISDSGVCSAVVGTSRHAV
jgi:hypothetical protein